MFQSLLAERFQVKLHKEQKEFPVYALIAGKGPLKLKETPPALETDKAEPKGTVNVAAMVPAPEWASISGTAPYPSPITDLKPKS